jgi:TetR/AcrR family fatty acid metabolism transcriptional regulator
MRLKEGNKEKDILNAARVIFATKGFERAKITEIAKMAKIATGSVYLYFDNKEEILLRLLFDLWNKIYLNSIAISIETHKDPVTRVDEIINTSMLYLMEDKNLALIYGNEQNLWMVKRKGSFREKYQHFLGIFKDLLAEGIAAKKFRVVEHPELMITFIIGGIRNMIHSWALEESPEESEMVIQKIKSVIFSVIS